jgi:hypothetical protein
MNYDGKILIPYSLSQEDLILDPAAEKSTMPEDFWSTMRFLDHTDNSNSLEEMELIFRSTVLLFAAKAGTFSQCFETAVIWARG